MRKNKAIISAIMIMTLVWGLLLQCDAGAEESVIWPSGPDISASAAIVIDAETGAILYEKDIYTKYYPASTTKILTTLVALENSSPDEIVTVSYAADNYVSKTSSRMGLVEGEQLTMEQALYGIMLESANEATYAVGEHVGGSIARFIRMMNWKAESLGCTNSHFANSHGLHDDDHYTCCYDMSLIARAAYQNPAFMEINGTASYNMPQTNKNEAKVLTNHHWFLNKRMAYDYCIGGKTGATNQAGYALVTYARKAGMTLISVVMHAATWDTVYNESKQLLEYTFKTFKRYDMSTVESQKSTIPSMFDGTDIELFSEGRASVISNGTGGVVILPETVTAGQTEKTISYKSNLVLEHGENVIGSIVYRYGERIVGTSDIVFYNAGGSTSSKKEWPSFLVPVEELYGESDEGAINSSVQADRELELSDIVNVRRLQPILVGVGAGVLVLLVGILIIIRRRN